MKYAPILTLIVLLSACIGGGDNGVETNDIMRIAERKGWESAAMNEMELDLLTILPERYKTGSSHAIVFLVRNDRHIAARWTNVSSPAKAIAVLREKIFQNISKQAEDIVDDRIEPAQSSPIDLLAFTDKSISSDRIIVAVIRNELYELHVAEANTNEALSLLLSIARID